MEFINFSLFLILLIEFVFDIEKV